MEEINLKSVYYYFLERIKDIVKLACIISLVIFALMLIFKRPMFTNSTNIIFNSSSVNSNVLSRYSSIVKSEDVINDVTSELDINKDISKYITVNAITESNSLDIIVQSNSNKFTKKLSNQINESFVNYIKGLDGNQNLKIIIGSNEKNNIFVDYAIDIVACLFIGALISCVYIFVKYYLSNNIKSEDDIINMFKLKLLGVVPVENEELHSNAIDNIRKQIQILGDDKSIKSILFCSTDESVDNSNVIESLAKSYISEGNKVAILSLNNSKYCSMNNLQLVTSSHLDFKNNKKLIKELSEKCDILLIDCPQVLGSTGTIVLSKLVDFNILVLNHEKTSYDSINKSKNIFEENNGSIDGVIVNGILSSTKTYSKYYIDNIK